MGLQRIGQKLSDCVCLVAQSCLTLGTPQTVTCQAPVSMGFSRQEYWSEFPFPSPGDLPDPGIEPRSPALQVGSLPTELQGKPIINYREFKNMINTKRPDFHFFRD